MSPQTRSSPILPLLATLPLLAVPLHPEAAPAQEEAREVRIAVSHAGGDVYMLAGRGGNIGALVAEDGVLLVDDQFAPLAPRIRAALEGLGQGRVEYVLNTHWHGDHTGGNEVFGRESPILAHANVRRRLSSRQESGDEVREPAPEVALPEITFVDSVTVHFGGQEVRVIHFPHAHTDGDAAVFFSGANVVHAGDLYFAGQLPFVDLASGGDVEGMIRAVERVLAAVPDDATVIPGHGPLSNVRELREYHRMLEETTDHVRRAMSRGMGLQQIVAAGLPEEWEGWATDFMPEDRWIETIYRSLVE